MFACKYCTRSLDPFIQESGWCQNESMMETEEPQVVWQEGGKRKAEGGRMPRQLSAVDHHMCWVVWSVNLLDTDHLQQTSVRMKATRSFKPELLTGPLLYPLSDLYCSSGPHCGRLVCLIRENSSFSPVFTASGTTLPLRLQLKQLLLFFINSIWLEGDRQRSFLCRNLMCQNQHGWWCHYPTSKPFVTSQAVLYFLFVLAHTLNWLWLWTSVASQEHVGRPHSSCRCWPTFLVGSVSHLNLVGGQKCENLPLPWRPLWLPRRWLLGNNTDACR